MKTRSKALLLSMCAVVLVIGSVFGTIAYLTDTEAVTNTFSVGSVGLKLDEAKVDEDGIPVGTERTEEGNKYHLIPGHTYTKDPTVTVDDGSEDAYVRMLVKVEGLENLKAVFTDPKYYADGVFLLQTLTPDWDSESWPYAGFDPETNTYEFRYKASVPGNTKDGDAVTLEPLFKTVAVPGEDVTNENIGNLEKVEITVTAHAIQAAGFTDVNAAWDAFSK